MSEVAAQSLPSQRQSLLNKYDIPIDHLDFDYVKSCKKIKELEKIVKILRSNEEGYFPDLLKATENRLEELDPTNRLLRVEGVALTKDTLDPHYWKQIYDDIEKWSDECTQKEKDLLSVKKNSAVEVEDSFPPIRRPPMKMETNEKPVDKKNDKIGSFDYDKWDKFDADAECLKMDLEEEKRQQETPPCKKTETASALKQLEESVKSSVSMSQAEKEILANKEKELGNEFYKVKDYKQATRSYTKSIAIFPTSYSYNNRAASFLNLELYDLAVSDTNEVLQMEPNNVKALYRRAQAYEKLSEFTKALSDLNSILKLEPDNNLAKSMKEKLKNKKSSAKPKSSARSNAKRSKLTLDGNTESLAGTSGTSSHKSSSEGRGEPVPGPSGVNTKRLATETKPPARNEGAKAKRGMRKVDVLEVDRCEGSILKRYWAEGRSAKIEVASKFREKSSKEPRPTESHEQDNLINHNFIPSPPSVEPLENRQLEPQRVSAMDIAKPIQYEPSNFTQAWELLNRERAPMSEKAQLLRSIRPHLLQSVIGNKLEEEMLSDFLCCLRDEFKLKTEIPLVIEYLSSFARLERFTIIKTFLPTEIKQVIQELMDRINAGANLRKLYL